MRFDVAKVGDGMEVITAMPAEDSGLPTAAAFVKLLYPGVCRVTISVDGLTIADANIKRGVAFGRCVARCMLKGCISRLGKHRRLTANRQARKAGDGAPGAKHLKEGK